jgi:hypothetical protein
VVTITKNSVMFLRTFFMNSIPTSDSIQKAGCL